MREHTSTDVKQLVELERCFEIYQERSAKYGEVWKQYGAINNLVRAATKVDRLMEQWWFDPPPHDYDLDDAYDAINYLIFFIRNVKEINFTGERPVRPDV
jgi:hypothetical protein